MRWNHREDGLKAPLTFVPLAEETGLIVPIGQFVLDRACRQATAWHRTAGSGDLAIHVNLSAIELQQDDLPHQVGRVLAAAGLRPEQLVLEITESVLMRDAQLSLERLQALKSLGVRLALDDFGTGYSSLGYLRWFPFDILKIARSFLDGIAEGTKERAVVRTIIELARTLEVQVIAEGIESAEQVRVLAELDCELGQGFYFARPRDAETDALLTVAGAVPAALGAA